MTHVLHTARISNDERVLYNDTETLIVRLLSHLLGSYVTHVLHTARISNDDRVLNNDTQTITDINRDYTPALVTLAGFIFTRIPLFFACKTIYWIHI